MQLQELNRLQARSGSRAAAVPRNRAAQVREGRHKGPAFHPSRACGTPHV